MVTDGDRLGALQVRITGNAHLRILGSFLHQGPLHILEQLQCFVNLSAAVQARIGGHLVIAGAGGVQLGTGGPDAAGQLAFDVHVHILELHAPAEVAGLDVGQDLLQAVGNGIELILREHAGFQLGAGMRRGAGNVVFIKLPVVGNGFTVLQYQICRRL